MIRNQRRRQQLKQTVQMKLSVLEKQKDDIKEIIDDYTSNVVGEISNLLSKEQELNHDPGQYHKIIEELDKASQVLSQVAITLDSILYADESALSEFVSDKGNVLKQDECVTSENLDNGCSLSLTKQYDCLTGQLSVQDKDSKQDQLHEEDQSHLIMEYPEGQVQNEKYKNQEHLKRQREEQLEKRILKLEKEKQEMYRNQNQEQNENQRLEQQKNQRLEKQNENQRPEHHENPEHYNNQRVEQHNTQRLEQHETQRLEQQKNQSLEYNENQRLEQQHANQRPESHANLRLEQHEYQRLEHSENQRLEQQHANQRPESHVNLRLEQHEYQRLEHSENQRLEQHDNHRSEQQKNQRQKHKENQRLEQQKNHRQAYFESERQEYFENQMQEYFVNQRQEYLENQMQEYFENQRLEQQKNLKLEHSENQRLEQQHANQRPESHANLRLEQHEYQRLEQYGNQKLEQHENKRLEQHENQRIEQYENQRLEEHKSQRIGQHENQRIEQHENHRLDHDENQRIEQYENQRLDHDENHKLEEHENKRLQQHENEILEQQKSHRQKKKKKEMYHEKHKHQELMLNEVKCTSPRRNVVVQDPITHEIIELTPAQFGPESQKTEGASSSLASPLTSSVSPASSLSHASASTSTSTQDEHSVTHNFASASVPLVKNKLLEPSSVKSLPVNTWFTEPLLCVQLPISSRQSQPSIYDGAVFYGDPLRIQNIPQISYQPSADPFVSDQCGRIMPVVFDAIPLMDIPSGVPFDIRSTGSHPPEHYSSYDIIFQNQSVLPPHDLPCSWTAPNQNIKSFLNISEPLYPHSQSNLQNNNAIMLNRISQDQQPNCTAPSPNSASATAITVLADFTTTVSDSSESSPQPSNSVTTACDLSLRNSAMQQDLPSHISSVSQSPNGETEYNTSEQSCHQHTSETLITSIVTTNCTSTSVLVESSQGSFTESTQSSKYDSCSQLEATPLTLELPKCLTQYLPMKKNTKKSSRHTRSLQELIKEVEKNAHVKSAKCDVIRTSVNNATEQVIKTGGTNAQTEESESRFVSRKDGPKEMANQIQAKSSSGEGSTKRDNLEEHLLTTEETYLNIWPLEPDKDAVFPAVISNLTHPWSFHVQVTGFIKVLAGLIKHAMDSGASKAIAPQQGLYCLTKLCEQSYHRAQILSLQEQHEQSTGVKVLFIDYGTKKVVSPADIYSIPDSLKKHPSQAMFCALQRASPKNKHYLWTEAAILEFQQQTKDAQVKVKVVHPSPTDVKRHSVFPHIVDIMFAVPQVSLTAQKEKTTYISMATHLIEKDVARFIKEEDQISALDEMYSLSKHIARDKAENVEVSIFNTKAPPFDETPAKTTHSNEKVLYQCFQKAKDHNLNTSSRTGTSNSSMSTSSCVDSTSNLIEVRAATQKMAYHELSIVVNEKLHLLGEIIRSSQVELMKKEAFIVPDQGTKNVPTKHFKSLQSNDSSSLNNGDDAEVEILAMVSSVISPSSFFVHQLDKDLVHKLKKLVQELHSLSASALSKLSSSFIPTVNLIVNAQWSKDGDFYRGLVLEIEHPEGEHRNSAEDQLLIFFIDYGDFDWVARSHVFPLSKKLKNLPPLVLWCSLKNVKPNGTVAAGDNKAAGPLVWSDNAVKEFKSMVCEEKVLSVVMSQASLNQVNNLTSFQFEPMPVFLLDKNVIGEELCINHELIIMKLASLSLSVSETDHNSNDQEWDPMNEEYTSIRNSYKVDTEEAGVALVGYTPGNTGRDGKKVCVYFNKPRGCLRGGRCPNFHVKVDINDVWSEKVPVRVFDEDQTDLMPQPGSTVTVTVSVVITPSLFYVNFPWGHSNLKHIQRNPQVLNEYLQEETLESMMDNMQIFYSKSTHYDGDLMLLAPGQAMAAHILGHWVRAKVLDTDVERGLVQVMSVDFGSVSWVDERDLRELGLQFLHLTPQAMECSLVDLEPQEEDSDWTEETCQYFAEMVKGKTLVALVKQRYPSGRISVILHNTRESTNTSVNQRLVDSGLAKLATNSGKAHKRDAEETQRTDHDLMTNCMPS